MPLLSDKLSPFSISTNTQTECKKHTCSTWNDRAHQVPTSHAWYSALEIPLEVNSTHSANAWVEQDWRILAWIYVNCILWHEELQRTRYNTVRNANIKILKLLLISCVNLNNQDHINATDMAKSGDPNPNDSSVNKYSFCLIKT